MYLPAPLGVGHSRSTFDSGRPPLDEWLRTHALTVQQRGLGRTFVWVDESDPTVVVAYYALAAHVIEQQTLTRRLARGLPRQLPAVLLARLALDKTLHGRGLGGALLAEAMSRVAHISDDLGAHFVVVDAIDAPAADFYQHYGFTPVPDQESMRLVQRIPRRIADVD